MFDLIFFKKTIKVTNKILPTEMCIHHHFQFISDINNLNDVFEAHNQQRRLYNNVNLLQTYGISCRKLSSPGNETQQVFIVNEIWDSMALFAYISVCERMYQIRYLKHALTSKHPFACLVNLTPRLWLFLGIVCRFRKVQHKMIFFILYTHNVFLRIHVWNIWRNKFIILSTEKLSAITVIHFLKANIFFPTYTEIKSNNNSQDCSTVIIFCSDIQTSTNSTQYI